MPPPPGPLVLGRYAILDAVGSGAFGQVFRVLDTQANATRALKVVPPGPHETRLLDEFAQLAKLAHPSLPAVYDVGRARDAIAALPAGSPFFVADWIDGVPSTALPSLAGASTRGARLWSWLADIAAALATIHAAGLVHADVAPGNVLVTPDRAVLVDLGLAADARDASARGTPAFMAPEAFVGRIEPRSDLYSLGATAIAALIGRPPFDAPSIGALVQLVISRSQPLPTLPGVPAPLVDLITRLLARDVDDRPPSALAVLDELDQLAPAVAPSLPRRARPAAAAPRAVASWPGASAAIAQIADALSDSRGEASRGEASRGEASRGEASRGEASRGEASRGEASRGEASRGEASRGEASRGEASRGEASTRAPMVVVGPREAGGRLLVDAAIARWQLDRVAHQQPAVARSVTLDELGDLLAVSAESRDRGSRAWLEQLARALSSNNPSSNNPSSNNSSSNSSSSNNPSSNNPSSNNPSSNNPSSNNPSSNNPSSNNPSSNNPSSNNPSSNNPSSNNPSERGFDALVIDVVEDPRTPDFLHALARAFSNGARPVASGTASRPLVVLAETPPPHDAAIRVVVAPSLDAAGGSALAERMLGKRPAPRWVDGLLAASGGLPLTVLELLRGAATESDPLAIDWAQRASEGSTTLRTRQLASLSPAARWIAETIVVFGGRARVERVLDTARAFHRLAETARVAGDVSAETPRDRASQSVGLADVVELERAGLATRSGDELAVDRSTSAAVEVGERSGSLATIAGTALTLYAPDGTRSTSGDARSTSRDERSTSRDARSTSGGARSTPGDAQPVPSDLSPASGEPPSTQVTRVRIPLGASPDSDANASAPFVWLAPLLERAAVDPRRATLALGIATELLARGRADRSLTLARHVARAPALANDSLRGEAHLIAARASAALAAYGEAVEEARAAVKAGADPIEARLVLARTAQRAGDLASAERELEALHAEHPAHAEIAGTYARLLVTRSRYANARSVATNGALAKTPLSGLRAEAAGLAAFYLGELDAAESAFAALEKGARDAHDTLSTGRALSLRGMVAQQRGQLGRASERYAEAAKRLGDVGEIHAAATAELNLGTVLAERGRASEGLPRLAAAERVFTELGATTELCAAELNRGNALVAVNQFAEAKLAARAAVERTAGVPHLRAFALIVYGDALDRSGEHEAGAAAYREALAIALERKDSHAQISAYIALAEAGHRDGDGVDVAALCASEDDSDRWTVARGKLVLRAGSPVEPSELLALAKACSDVAHRSSMADRLERAFRAHAVASGLAQRAGDSAVAMREARDARSVHASLVSVAAPAFRAALDEDPDLAWLRGFTAEDSMNGRSAAVVELRPGNHAVLRRLLTLSRRMNSEASVDRILDDVIDTAIELTDAERGFLLLRQPDGELAAVVARNFGAGELSPDAASEGQRGVSRSIAERAAQTGEPVMTVDAGVDERFGTAASVATMRLRSVLAVPLRQRGTIIGCIYVDHRLRGGAFDEHAASLLGELADIAAIAIENARLTQELRSTTKAVDELNGRLSAELADRDAELVRVRAELPARERLRGAYDAIVGRSPAMLRMLDVIDRAAATSLPVVIVGESGTGKELVARALHDHGPRAKGPFVAINCSAVPEALLESELFGHVRGAFTGAERDRRGLFEVADGGTLFLDEIADTTPAMQAKLLRVLQDGMIRRVGDTATRKVDVRVLAASQQPLAALVTQGRFREDLRFRIEVIQVPVPPLREREGDIAVLVERLLARLAPKAPLPRLTRAALRALQQHRWPGNVRELENALARGIAMGGEVIDVGDLPEVIANAAARPEPTKPVVSEDLQLKPALAATEYAYITAAMARAKNNQTVAARLLGLSRFGLQKKLRRLAGEDAATDDE